MNFPVIEMFASIQGEGQFTGIPSFFVRVSGCNLRCCFKGSICDTPYSSYEPEKTGYETMDDVVKAFKKLREENPNVKHLVITGGEPLMYKKGLEEFLEATYDEDLLVTIETNGTFEPLPSFSNKYTIDLYSISPKLSTSVGNANGKLTVEQVKHHNETRINLKALCEFVLKSIGYQFKFVYSGPECIGEIKQLYADMQKYVDENFSEDQKQYYDTFSPTEFNQFTMLMPEGITNEQLAKSRIECAEVCVKEGWQYTDRTHIIIWGDKRGV